jgi:hypothetical protein
LRSTENPWKASGLEDLWSETLGDPQICVAILDGPVDRSHESLRHAALMDVKSVKPSGGVASRHGTHIASIIFGQHDGPVLGIAPLCRGLLIPIFKDDVTGKFPACSQEELGHAINAAVQAGAHIINISAGELSPHNPTDPFLEEAVRNCVTSGVLIVAAAGNQGRSHMQVPGALPSVLGVGAMNAQGEPLESSNWSAFCESCGLLAPGESILGALPDGGTGVDSGTSCAAAIVSGVAALLLSLQLKYGHKLDPYLVREVLLNSALKRKGDSDRLLKGRLNIRGALSLLKAKLGVTFTGRAQQVFVEGYHRPVPVSYTAYAITPQALKDRYGGVSPEKFGTIDITLPSGRSYNVQDLYYPVSHNQLGMRFIPVSDDGNVILPDGTSAPGSAVIDNLLHQEMGLKLEDPIPIYALLSYIRPEEHSSDLFRLPDTQKLQMGHRHLGAYLGRGRTTHVLPRKKGDWKGEGPLKMKWNVDRYPANVHIISLHGVPQSTLNKNAHIVNSILASSGKSPADTQTVKCRTIDTNTTLQFYRDSIRRAEYLEDLSWFTNCAVHTTIVINVLVNVPHNERSFQEIFDEDGSQLWLDFKRRYEDIHGQAFGPNDETYFEPLWKLAGLPVERIRPLTFGEYNSFHAAKAEGWLDEYAGRTPLDPGKGLAWPLETVVDVVSRFLETYVNIRDVGGLTAAAVLLFLRHEAKDKLGLPEESYVQLVKPIVAKLILAEAVTKCSDAPAWLQGAKGEFHSLVGHAEREYCPDKEAGSSVEQVIQECVESAARQIAEIPKTECGEQVDAAAWFVNALEPELLRLQNLVYSGNVNAGFLSSPSIIHQIAQGLHPSSPFVKFRTLCTVMDQSELVLRRSPSSSDERKSELRALSPQREAAANWQFQKQKKEEILNMTDIKVALDTEVRKAEFHSPQSGRSPAMTPSANGVEPATCECEGNATDNPAQLVYVLGQIGYDFISESRLNSIKQKMDGEKRPEEPKDLLGYLDANPYNTSAIQWILKLDGTPIYAIEPQGPFAREAYDLLRQFLHEQMEEGVERVSIPGAISGMSRLRSGVVVPSIVPEIRGMYSWTTDALVTALCGPTPKEREGSEEYDAKKKGITNFLDRVYYQIRNIGRTPQERAINFAATNAFEIERVFENAMREDMDLDTTEVERSPICKIGADCWDVSLIFFFPQRQVQTVRKVYRFAVDVADVVPSTVGPVRSWFVR